MRGVERGNALPRPFGPGRPSGYLGSPSRPSPSAQPSGLFLAAHRRLAYRASRAVVEQAQPCLDGSAGADACARAFITRAAEQLFRRPLTAEQRAAYLAPLGGYPGAAPSERVGANVSETQHGKFLDAAPGLAAKNRRQVEYAVDLARRLDQVPEGEGTPLDHTLIVLFEDISHGGHGHDQWPMVLLGGFGGAVRPDRYVRLPRTRPNPGLNGLGDFIGVPHSHLLVAIARGAGLELDHLGIAEIPASGGRPALSLSGPLPELT